MGVENFCKFLDCILPPSSDLRPFDSILVDAQCFLHVAVRNSFHSHDRKKFFSEIRAHVWRSVSKLLDELVRRAKRTDALPGDRLAIVFSFDGSGVPMKWPTQRKRRADMSPSDERRVVQSSLFGHNVVSRIVERHLARNLKLYSRLPGPRTVRYVVCGSDVPGEGEHKLFHLLDADPSLRRPLVVSVDQDVFAIALARLERYDYLQIYRYGRAYSLSASDLEARGCPWRSLEASCVLFGNDFVPPLVSLTETNGPEIHAALESAEDENPPELVAGILSRLPGLRHRSVDFADPELLDAFWTCYLWVRDYYRKREFPQKYVRNRVFDAFDRNALLSGLSVERVSTECFARAERAYDRLVTSDPGDLEALRFVFPDSSVRDEIAETLLLVQSDREGASGECTVLTVSRNESRSEP